MSKLFKAPPHWPETREKGRSRFVWRSGVLGFGLSMCAVSVVMEYLWPSVGSYWPTLVTWPISGYLWGRFMWWWFERLYQRSAVPAEAR